MGFPVGYTEVFIPTLFIHTLTFFTILRNLLHHLFTSIGLPEFLEPGPLAATEPPLLTPPLGPTTPPLSAILTRELLPIVRVSQEQLQEQEKCAICLYKFYKGEEIRWLCNCKHIFHKQCVDSWMDLDHRTCPLCRTPFLLDDLLVEFNQRLLASDNDDYFCDNNLNFQYVSVDGRNYYYNYTSGLSSL